MAFTEDVLPLNISTNLEWEAMEVFVAFAPHLYIYIYNYMCTLYCASAGRAFAFRLAKVFKQNTEIISISGLSLQEMSAKSVV